jgi:hypothetical protein
VRAACDAANKMAEEWSMVWPRPEGPRLKPQKSKGNQGNNRGGQPYEARDPETACTCIQGILLCPCNIDFLLQLVPVVDLQQRAANCVIVSSAFLAEGFVDLLEVPGKFRDDFLLLTLAKCAVREPAAD